jgi:asparagine synthase (glutamine-hydrolysing)
MCGIAGIVGGGTRAREHMPAMLARLEQRGPDDQGVWQDEHIILGHRRLAIIDLSTAGHQPMEDERAVLVFNGTIYNYRALRRELQTLGHQFVSHGDTEVILKAWRQWGDAAILRLSGMFAFALWDKQQQRLLLARDRFGIKPLYYAELPSGGVVFASTTQAILASGMVRDELDEEALQFMFSLHGVVPAPRTILKQIRKVQPAHTIVLKQGALQEQRYWTLESHQNHECSEMQWQERAHDALKLAVKRRLDAADVPVGVLLSGGLDSSLLVALLAQTGAEHIKTFSIGFDDQPEEKGSEFEFSDQVVAQYHTDHHKIIIPNTDTLEALPRAVAHMTEPMFGQDAVGFYLLAEVVARHVKVVMSGQGADEVFAGYFWYPEMAAASGSDVARFMPRYVDRDASELQQMFRFNAGNVVEDWLAEQFSGIVADSYLGKVLNLDVTSLIVDDPVKRVDNMTMAHGLEARVPFLDHELVELMATMPDAYKLAHGGKGILKTLSRGLVPDAVIDRPKGYFPVPALKYVRGAFLDWMRDILLAPNARLRTVIEDDYITMLLADPAAHLTRIRGSKLWQLAVTELWLETHL